MPYVDLKIKMEGGDRDLILESILYILKKRKDKFHDRNIIDVKTKGLGSYLILKSINNNLRRKITHEQLGKYLDKMQSNGLIYYDKFYFYVIEKKGEIRLNFEGDKKGKNIAEIINKLF